MNLIQMLRRRVELQPGVPALIDHRLTGDRVISFSVLNRFVDFLSVRLREEKVQPGDRVVLLLKPSQEFYGFLLALLQVSAIGRSIPGFARLRPRLVSSPRPSGLNSS